MTTILEASRLVSVSATRLVIDLVPAGGRGIAVTRLGSRATVLNCFVEGEACQSQDKAFQPNLGRYIQKMIRFLQDRLKVTQCQLEALQSPLLP